MAVVRNTGFRPQLLRWGLAVNPRKSVDVSDAEWGDMLRRPAIRARVDDGTLVPSASAPVEAPEEGGEDSTLAPEGAPDLDGMDRDALKAFAESQGITDAVDMRLGTVNLRAAIKLAIA